MTIYDHNADPPARANYRQGAECVFLLPNGPSVPPDGALPAGLYWAGDDPAPPSPGPGQKVAYSRQIVGGKSVRVGTLVDVPLATLKAQAIARIKATTQDHIEAMYPPYWQRNVALGLRTVDEAAKMATDIEACVTEETRVEQAITDATDAAGVVAAEASLSLPAIARYEA